ncbi:MAG: hypothetical protein ABSE82_08160 [Nitrososphaerales archaeon]
MSNCSNCGTELNASSITYVSRDYAGETDGRKWSFTKIVPQCGVCGQATVKYDKEKAKN